MADLTPLLDSLLQKHNTHTRRTHSQPHDEFLKEAYRINTHIRSLTSYLRSIRAPYLSTATAPARSHHAQSSSLASKTRDHEKGKAKERTYLTDPQREAIDASSSTLLRDLNASISQLAKAEEVRQQTIDRIAVKKRGRVGGALLRWAEGDVDGGGHGEGGVIIAEEEQTTRMWRDGVLFYLGLKLREASEVQRGMTARRLEREVERSKSVLYKAKGGIPSGLIEEGDGFGGINGFGGGGKGGIGGGAGGGYKNKIPLGAVEIEDENRRAENQLSPEQLQLFEKENDDLLRHYEDTLDKVRTIERSVIEISSMQTEISANLSMQQENITQLVSDSFSTTENVGGGNKELKRATERKSTARMVFWATCGLCGFLITWDLVF